MTNLSSRSNGRFGRYEKGRDGEEKKVAKNEIKETVTSIDNDSNTLHRSYVAKYYMEMAHNRKLYMASTFSFPLYDFIVFLLVPYP